MISNKLLLAYSFYVRSRELTNRGLLDMAHLPLSPEGCLRPGKSGYEVHVEHHVGDVVLEHAPERGMHGDRRGVPEPHHHL
jgi:hypothetical protein